jgi:hypothetical protein
VKEVVQRQVTEHDEHGVMAVLAVLGTPLPVVIRELTESGDETRAVVYVLLQ